MADINQLALEALAVSDAPKPERKKQPDLSSPSWLVKSPLLLAVVLAATPVSLAWSKLAPSDATAEIVNMAQLPLISEPTAHKLMIPPPAPEQKVAVGGKSDLLSDLLNTVETPKPGKIAENGWKLRRELRRRMRTLTAFERKQLQCLAVAIYFEARSEPEGGQLAVAKVIMNRVRDKNYPGTICAVVWEGSWRKTGCQFSFTCDGRSDKPRSARAWRMSKRMASRAMLEPPQTTATSSATHYHADYVNPRWSGAMKRLVKIGRHIFYQDS